MIHVIDDRHIVGSFSPSKSKGKSDFCYLEDVMNTTDIVYKSTP